MKKLVFISVHPIHYNDFLFHQLDKDGVDINVYYTSKVLTNYPWKQKLNYTFPNKNCKYFLGMDWEVLKLAAFSRNTIFIVAGWDKLFKIVLLLTLILFRKKYVLFTDTMKVNTNRNPIKKALRSVLVNTILGNAYKIFTTGEIGVKTMKQVYNSDKIINFPFATDINFFNSEPDFSGFTKEKILLSTGRLLNSHKGYDVALHALKLVKDRGLNFKYLMAGDGPDRAMLKTLIENLGLKENVEMLGWQELGGLKELYNKAHLFIHPSHFDPFPNAVLEAMACGLIVIASDKAGSAVERITNKKSGFIFKDNDVTGLADIITEVLGFNQQQLQTISAEAKKVSKKWDITYQVGIVKRILSA